MSETRVYRLSFIRLSLSSTVTLGATGHLCLREILPWYDPNYEILSTKNSMTINTVKTESKCRRSNSQSLWFWDFNVWLVCCDWFPFNCVALGVATCFVLRLYILAQRIQQRRPRCILVMTASRQPPPQPAYQSQASALRRRDNNSVRSRLRERKAPDFLI